MDSIGELLFSYQGRITIGRFWFGYLVVLLANMATGFTIGFIANDGRGHLTSAGVALIVIFMIMAVYVHFSILVKRCHDRGKSGWMTLLAFVPLVGFFWVLIDLGILKGEPGPNEYGPDPRGNWSAAEVFE
jgi:uncharacterized membrane protein YhaH (DUF805 family)